MNSVGKRVMSSQSKKEDFELDGDNISLFNIPQRARLSIVKRYPPPKTTFAAILMLIGGIVFLISGLVVFFGNNKNDRGIPILAIGGILFIPGSYASYVLYGSWRGWQGFEYSQIPSYDDDELVR